LLSVPLIFDQQAIGVLSVYTGQPHSFSNEEITILSALADLSAITIEKARLYERIVDMEEQLRQGEKLSAIGLLAAEVAHEIRNPLTVMKMLFHSLDLRFPETDARARDVAIMGEKMEHLNKIVEQVLDYARTNEPRVVPVNINRLIDDLSLLTRHKLINQGIQLVRKLDPSLPSVMADATQLEQAFLECLVIRVRVAVIVEADLVEVPQAAVDRQIPTPIGRVALERDASSGMVRNCAVVPVGGMW
jgi:signal transduction histidine kinase